MRAPRRKRPQPRTIQPPPEGIDLCFDFEWQDPAGVRGEELRATWASLSIRIDDEPVTEVQDRRTKSVRTRIYLPLLPLAEWIAGNWWFLQSEPARPSNANDREFDRRHNLRWAREGFVLPSLRFVTTGDNIEAQWQPLDIPSAGIKFLSGGHAVLLGTNCIETLRDFVNAVLARLDSWGHSETMLHEEWTAVENADVDEQDFCHAAARLGVDPYATSDQLRGAILSVAESVRPELLQDFYSLANVHELATQATELTAAADAIAADPEAIDALAGVRNQAPQFSGGKNPWDTGYHYAAKLRAKLNGKGWKSRSLRELAGYLGIDQLDCCLLFEFGVCRFIDALTGPNQLNNPKFILDEKKRDDSQQFAFCRALFEHLTSPTDFVAVSGLRTDRQQLNRAFAAEFLAPHQMLRNDISATTIGEDEVAELADDYGVSEFLIRHQVENHRLAQIAY